MKGHTKAKMIEKGFTKEKNDEKGANEVKMKGPSKKVSSKKCLGLTRALIRPWRFQNTYHSLN
jgi:hypothetical protein